MSDRLEPIGGRERRVIELVSSQASWPTRFAHERERVAAALGDRACRIDHIGSTAVAGLEAKPIVDMQVSVSDPGDEPSYVPALERAGYRLRVCEPGHRMLRTPGRDVHIHVCATGSDWERRHLLFRDWLRHDPADRDRYVATKRKLAARPWTDMNAYADAKSPVIEKITARAERWAAATGWRTN